MKDKFKNALLALVKDYGLSDKAIDELVEQAIVGIPQDAGDDVVNQTANLYANIAKAMQGEVTRKVQKAMQERQQQQNQQQQQQEQPTPPVPQGMDEETKKAFEALQKQVKDLAEANAKAQAQAEAQAKAVQHQALVKESATKLGLPHSIALSIDTSKAESAEDVEKALAEFQQQLVNEQLAPKGVSATVTANEEKQMQSEAEAFANSLKSTQQ